MIENAGGDGQSAVVGEQLTLPISVLVLTADGTPAPNVPVTWEVLSGGGELDVDRVTDDFGVAEALWTLGTTAGPREASATVADVGSVRFTAVADAGPVAELRATTESVEVDLYAEGEAVAAVAEDRYGNEVPAEEVTWTSSNPGVAEVTAAGVIEPAGEGRAMLHVNLGSLSDSVEVVVVRNVASMEITRPENSLQAEGDTMRLGVTAYDGGGESMATPEVEWTSSSPEIAEIDQDGLLTARAIGETTVTATATSGGLSAEEVFLVDLDLTRGGRACQEQEDFRVGTLVGGDTLPGELTMLDCTIPDGTFAESWAFEAADSTRVQFDLSSDSFDPYLLIADAAGEVLEADNNGGPGNDAAHSLVLPPGDWRVYANTNATGSVGTYTLSASIGECTGRAATVDTVTVGSVVTSSISYTDCALFPPDGTLYERWVLELSEIMDVRFYAESSEFNTYLAVTDISGTGEVWQNDDINIFSDPNSLLTLTLEPGTYAIIVMQSLYVWEGLGDYGDYQLQVSTAAAASASQLTADPGPAEITSAVRERVDAALEAGGASSEKGDPKDLR